MTASRDIENHWELILKVNMTFMALFYENVIALLVNIRLCNMCTMCLFSPNIADY